MVIENLEFGYFHYKLIFFFQYYTIHPTTINSDILCMIGHIIVKRENYETRSLSKESHVPHKLLTNFGHNFVYLVIRLNNLLFFNYIFVWRSFICDVCSVRLNNSVVFVESEILFLFFAPILGGLIYEQSVCVTSYVITKYYQNYL